MQVHSKFLASGFLALSLLTGAALAGEAATPPTDPGEPWGPGKHHYNIQERLNQLHQELKLNADQETAWKTWFDRVQQARAEHKASRPDFEALRKLSAPERLEKFIEASKARQATLEGVLAATKTFYATLSPEQRKTFDDLTPFGERAPAWRRGGPHHGGGQ
ncbi:Spy/CpxP family protein refolding chaperone [Candidatus Methylocalor cossyra]|uniref:LTXXQ motif family protein n=1 Tax=Candidatus Methylocalor cossyra TaxID=3108543 RepID=A0ABP1C8B7_9GAMM